MNSICYNQKTFELDIVERIEHVNICGGPYIKILSNPYKIIIPF